jgi:hypothetical protein
MVMEGVVGIAVLMVVGVIVLLLHSLSQGTGRRTAQRAGGAQRRFRRMRLDVAALGGPRIAIRGEHGQARCSLCHDDLTGLEPDLVGCGTCGTVLHESCWTGLRRCPILGCVGRRAEKAGAPSPAASTWEKTWATPGFFDIPVSVLTTPDIPDSTHGHGSFSGNEAQVSHHSPTSHHRPDTDASWHHSHHADPGPSPHHSHDLGPTHHHIDPAPTHQHHFDPGPTHHHVDPGPTHFDPGPPMHFDPGPSHHH